MSWRRPSKVEEADLSVWSIEDVILLDPNHRQAAAFGGQGVSRPRGGLLFHEQLIACSLPLFPQYNLRLAHAFLVFIGPCVFIWFSFVFGGMASPAKLRTASAVNPPVIAAPAVSTSPMLDLGPAGFEDCRSP
jgi:hypothetical protein